MYVCILILVYSVCMHVVMFANLNVFVLGMAGVPISSVEDMKILFQGIPLDKVVFKVSIHHLRMYICMYVCMYVICACRYRFR